MKTMIKRILLAIALIAFGHSILVAQTTRCVGEYIDFPDAISPPPASVLVNLFIGWRTSGCGPLGRQDFAPQNDYAPYNLPGNNPVRFTFTQPGTYYFEKYCNGYMGGVFTEYVHFTATVVVSNCNYINPADAGARTCQGATKTYNGSGPPSFGTINDVGWTVQFNGGAKVRVAGNVPSINYTFNQIGTYKIEKFFEGYSGQYPISGLLSSTTETVIDCNTVAVTPPPMPCLTCKTNLNNICLNDIETLPGQTTYAENQVANWEWRVSNGHILSQSFNNVQVRWNATGVSCVEFRYHRRVGNQWRLETVQYSRNVMNQYRPAVPPATVTVKYDIGEATLSYPQTPPSDETWYWETTPNGTSGTQNNKTLTVYSPGTYYLRAYKLCGWSHEVVTVQVLPTEWRLLRPNTGEITVKVPGKKSPASLDLTNFRETNASIQYLDGLGRPEQRIDLGASTGEFDVVTPFAYDNVGRSATQYIPYVSGERDGSYRPNALGSASYETSDQFLYYQQAVKQARDLQPYALARYEASPLERVVKQGATGAAWQPDADHSFNSPDHTTKHAYETSPLSEVLRLYYEYPQAASPLGSVTFGKSSVYNTKNQFQKRRTRDEEGNETSEYVDKTGKVVVRRVQADNGRQAETYYVYNDYGNLVGVLQPEGAKALRETLMPVWKSNANVGIGIGTESTLNWITKTATTAGYGNAGTISTETLPANTDGWVEMVAGETNTSRMLGLASSNVNNGTSIQYAVELRSDGKIYAWENGASLASLGDYRTGTTVRVAREGTSVKYYVDGVAKRTSSVASTQSLMIDVALDHPGATIRDVSSSFQLSANLPGILNNYGFLYVYDGRRRMTRKKVPGAAPVYMVYDRLNRLALTQDGNQRAGNYWTFIKYDRLNRPILTGVKDTTEVSQEGMQQAVDAHYAKLSSRYGESFVGYGQANVHGYSNRSYPVFTSGVLTDENHYLTVSYYDNYQFKTGWFGNNYDYLDAGLAETVHGVHYPATPYSQPYAHVLGQVTGVKVKILEDGLRGTYSWLKTASYYDERHRVIQEVAENIKGGVDRQSTLYDFTGQILRTRTVHEESDVAWTDLVGARVMGNRLYRNITNNTWGQAGAASRQVLASDQDGWVEFTATETNKSRMLGLSPRNADANHTGILYKFYLREDGALIVRQGSAELKTIPNGFKTGDVLRIAREGGTIKYYQNGLEIYPAGVQVQDTSSSQLLVDVAFANSGGSLANVRSSFSGSTHTADRRFVYDHAGRLEEVYHSLGNAVTWENTVGAAVTGNQLTKTATAETWGAGAVSAERIPAGSDGWIEFRAVDRNTARMIGLSDQNASAHFDDLDYGVYLRNNGALAIYENGQATGITKTYFTNDIIRIERRGTTVTYKVNDRVLHTSTVSSTAELRADCSIYTPGAVLSYVFIGTGPGASEVLLAKHRYNDLGQLVDKDLHSVSGTPFRQSVDYRYNIRGWLTSINDASLANDGVINDDDGVAKDYFGMNLAYQTTVAGLANTPRYNGNISGAAWSHNLGLGVVKQKGYTYSYDPSNRLSGSIMKKRTSTVWNTVANNGVAETGITYDLNGNILTLLRNDDRLTGTMDNLVYDYGTGPTRSNRLLKVTDAGDVAAGFTDGSNTTGDYAYDDNGNLRRDLNKGIGTSLTDANNQVVYNILNLPQTITKGEHVIRYVYDALGNKLSQQVGVGPAMKQSDNVGEFVYEDDVLIFVGHDEGRIAVSGRKKVYENACNDTEDVTGKDATLSALTTGSETYVKATASAAGRAGIFPVGPGVIVNGGERYLIRAKAYRMRGSVSTSHAANILVTVENADLGWPGALVPVATTAIKTESWIEQIVTIPLSPSGEAMLMKAGIVGNSTFAPGEELYLNAFEIVQLEDKAPAYEYYIKDHLDNVRLTFTSIPDAPETVATDFESADDGTFENYSRTPFDLVDHTDTGTAKQYVQWLNGGVNGRVGVAKTFKVMPGDVVQGRAYAKYMNLGTTANAAPLINSLAGAFGVSASSVGEQLSLYEGLNDYTNLVAGGDHAGDSESVPKVFVTILFFDEKHNFVDAAWDQITSAGAQTSSSVKQPPHATLNIVATAKEAGYAYLFVSNEHPFFVDVYFDDVTYTHTPSAIVAIEDYYPYGMTSSSGIRQTALPQNRKYNSMEYKDDLDLRWYDYLARYYDPEIGRFTSVDPMADVSRRWSPYHYGYNNPVQFKDPDGMYPEDVNSQCDDCQTSRYTTITAQTGIVKVNGKDVAVTMVKEQTKEVKSITVTENHVVVEAEITNTTTTVAIDGAGNVVSATTETTSYLQGENGKKGTEYSSKSEGTYENGTIKTKDGDQVTLDTDFSEIVTEVSDFERANHESYALKKAEEQNDRDFNFIFEAVDQVFGWLGIVEAATKGGSRLTEKVADDGVRLLEKHRTTWMGNSDERKKKY